MSDDTHAAILGSVAGYYERQLAKHGPTSRGVDWKDDASQTLRFEVLAELCPDLLDASVLDFGCGVGALLSFLETRGFRGSYHGFDISSEMIDAARASHPGPAGTWSTELPAGREFDYVIASGLFNVRLEHSAEAWEAYVTVTLDRMMGLAGRGMAFNFLTGFSDAEFMRADLYYADPGRWLNHCLSHYGRRVRLEHDYPLYEFSVYVEAER